MPAGSICQSRNTRVLTACTPPAAYCRNGNCPCPGHTNTVPEIVVLNRDLFFGVRIGNALRDAGYAVTFRPATTAFAAAVRAAEPPAVLGLIDLGADPDWIGDLANSRGRRAHDPDSRVRTAQECRRLPGREGRRDHPDRLQRRLPPGYAGADPALCSGLNVRSGYSWLFSGKSRPSGDRRRCPN